LYYVTSTANSKLYCVNHVLALLDVILSQMRHIPVNLQAILSGFQASNRTVRPVSIDGNSIVNENIKKSRQAQCKAHQQQTKLHCWAVVRQGGQAVIFTNMNVFV
jgi:hypothetical protein